MRAEVQGTPFSRERAGERVMGTDANVVLGKSVRLPHGKRHINNILYKLLQQNMLICNTVSSDLKCTTPSEVTRQY